MLTVVLLESAWMSSRAAKEAMTSWPLRCARDILPPLPISSSSSARCACSRFSAWSTTTELGPSSTASSISTFRRTGRQCITMPRPPRVDFTRAGVSRQSRSPARWAASSAAAVELHRAPRLHVHRVRAHGRLVRIVDDVDELAARLLRDPADHGILGIQLEPRRPGDHDLHAEARGRERRARGTAVGSAFGCQAQVSTKRLPEVSPSFSRRVIASASA